MQDVAEKKASGSGLRERKKRATRAALTEAAVRLAAEHGAEHVTVEAISEAAGVSPRTFFNYFDARDDAFVMVDAESGARVRRGVLEAPAGLSPLEALREAMAAELAEIEQRHEVWDLHARVLSASPHLLARSLAAHLADELGLAEALTERLGGAPAAAGPASSASERERRGALDLYPRLLAAVGGTAVRVAVEHWCAQRDRLAFTDVFRQVFEHLAAGLPAPSGGNRRR
ncbi:TetR family transcriptional regulator [Streptomyces chitinivorans]|uniref:TetR family transcriptional regulator n=1 Tax=Streptomyces chitinivorans TaxID=1257027 RepID=A0ABW7HR34_9ACTN|nr:TetR/AcrR family transcriptional regulator [Streptomyces chitinivorans]MDH2408495.1 TetR family transcriptional regulator [Streptomyces chitinivorans]